MKPIDLLLELQKRLETHPDKDGGINGHRSKSGNIFLCKAECVIQLFSKDPQCEEFIKLKQYLKDELNLEVLDDDTGFIEVWCK
jgi:hypothetical protein